MKKDKLSLSGDVLSPKIIITKESLVWIAKSLASDTARKVLMHAQVRFDHGRCWIVSTDTHRLHVAKCQMQGEVKQDPFFLNVRRAIMELAYFGGLAIEIDQSMGAVNVVGKKDIVLGQADKVFDVPEGTYPAIDKVCPSVKPKSVAPIFLVNFKYWTDATSRAAKYANRVTWWTVDPSRPVIISHALSFNPLNSDLDWFAVVMPMAQHGEGCEVNPVAVEVLEGMEL
jgi:hypothetical protein